MTAEYLATSRPALFHTTDVSARAGIERYGLLSASELAALCGVQGDNAVELRERRRSQAITLPSSDGYEFVLRDQKPMSDKTLRKCLDDSLEPSDWYRAVNSRVFFFVHPNKVTQLQSAKATAGSKKLLLKIDTKSFLSKYYEVCEVTTFNVGFALRKPVRRSLRSFIPLRRYSGSISRIVELTVPGSVPDIMDFISD